jgi:hypothetical protein
MPIDTFYLLSWLAYAASPSAKYDATYDLNGDGAITIADLLELLTLFGTTI